MDHQNSLVIIPDYMSKNLFDRKSKENKMFFFNYLSLFLSFLTSCYCRYRFIIISHCHIIIRIITIIGIGNNLNKYHNNDLNIRKNDLIFKIIVSLAPQHHRHSVLLVHWIYWVDVFVVF